MAQVEREITAAAVVVVVVVIANHLLLLIVVNNVVVVDNAIVDAVLFAIVSILPLLLVSPLLSTHSLIPLSPPHPPSSPSRTIHQHTHARTHAYMHACTHTHTHTEGHPRPRRRRQVPAISRAAPNEGSAPHFPIHTELNLVSDEQPDEDGYYNFTVCPQANCTLYLAR